MPPDGQRKVKTRRREPALRNGGRSIGSSVIVPVPGTRGKLHRPRLPPRWGRSLSRKTLMSQDRGWRQNLSYRRGYIEAKRREPFSCAWWADEEVYELGFLHGGNFLGAVLSHRSETVSVSRARS